MKIICFYLPQFHETEENNRWWGKGYTEWCAVKKCKPVLRGQKLPRHPLNGNYYDLGDESGAVWRWQAELAKKYGIYGFCIYHYWFAGKKLLNKPAEILRDHPEIDIPYSLCWDNNEWRRTWYRNQYEQELLMPQDYGNEEVWRRHFEDLLPFFQDSRYIKRENKPVFHIYQAIKIEELVPMRECWDRLARENGFAGIFLVAGNTATERNLEIAGADAYYNFEPNRTTNQNYYTSEIGYLIEGKKRLSKFLNALHISNRIGHKRNARRWYQLIVKEKYFQKKPVYEGLFVGFDDTPRRQDECTVYTGMTPRLFYRYLRKLLRKSEQQGKEFLYLNAWNEWGENAYLEPDEEFGFQYLESVKLALETYGKQGNN